MEPLAPDKNKSVCPACARLPHGRSPHVSAARQRRVAEERLRLQRLGDARCAVLRAGKAAVLEVCGADAEGLLPSPLPLLGAVRAAPLMSELPPALAEVTRLCRQLVVASFQVDKYRSVTVAA